VNQKSLAHLIDHTVLGAGATAKDVEEACRNAVEWGCAAVCVNPARVPRAAELLAGSELAVCSTVAFPLGAVDPVEKAWSASNAVERGASEVDVVVNLGAIRDGDWEVVRSEIDAVRAATEDRVVKLIVESAALDTEDLRRVSQMAADGGIDFVKTSTGYSEFGGASIESVRIITEAVQGHAKVKASGGISSAQFALDLVSSGASRLGISRTADVLAEVPE